MSLLRTETRSKLRDAPLRAARLAGTAALLLVVAYAALPPFSGTALVRVWMERRAGIGGYDVRMETFHIGYDLSATAVRVSVAEPGAEPFFYARRIASGPDFRALPEFKAAAVLIDNPEIFVERLPPGSGETGDLPGDSFGRIEIAGGVVRVRTGEEGEVALGPINARIDSLRGGEELRMKGRLLSVAAGTSARWSLRLDLDDLQMEGRIDATVDNLGRMAGDIASLELPAVLEPIETEVHAELSGSLLGRTKVNWTAEASHPDAPAPLRLRGRAEFDSEKAELDAQQTLHIGEALPEVTLEASLGDLGGEDPPTLEAHLQWPRSDVAALVEKLPGILPPPVEKAVGIVGGSIAVRGRLDSLTAIGEITVRDGEIAGGDWKLSTNVRIPFVMSSSELALDESGAQLTELSYADEEWHVAVTGVTVEGALFGDDGALRRGAFHVGLDEVSVRHDESLVMREAMAIADFAFAPGRDRDVVLAIEAKATEGTLVWASGRDVDLHERALSVDGEVRLTEAALTADGTVFALEGFGEAAITGSYGRADGRWDAVAEVDIADLAELGKELAAAAARPGDPTSGGLSLGGHLSGTMRMEGGAGEGPRVAGLFSVADGVVGGDEWNLRAKVELPFVMTAGRLEVGERGIRMEPLEGAVGEFKLYGTSATLDGHYSWLEEDVGEGAFELKTEGLSFEDAEFVRAGEGLSAGLAGNVVVASEESWTLAVDGAVTHGEVLWNRFYAELEPRPLTFEGELELQSANHLVLKSGKAQARGLVSVVGSGDLDLESNAYSLHAGLDIPAASDVFRLAVAEPFGSSYPVLGGMEVSGGLSAALEHHHSDDEPDWTVGKVDTRALKISSSEPQLAMEGLDASVPVLLGSNANAKGVAGGRLAVAGLDLGGVEGTGFTVDLEATPDELAARGGFGISLLGGEITVSRLDFARTEEGSVVVGLALAAEGLDIGPVTDVLEWPHADGKLSGAFDSVRIDGEALATEGTFELQVFGGTVRLSNLRVDALLSRVPTIGMDIEFDEIDLDLLTAASSLGGVSGLMRGEIKGLRIADGQAVAFDAWMESVPRRGVPQRLSVSAIRQISIVGGSGTDPGSVSFVPFFETYRYAKMGVRCRLENDRFTVRGMEQYEGKEFLVVGSRIPPSVNVVSHRHEVPFSQMVKLVRRLLAVEQF